MTELAWVTDASSDLDPWIKNLFEGAIKHRSHKIEIRPGECITGAGMQREKIDNGLFLGLIPLFRKYSRYPKDPLPDPKKDWNTCIEGREVDGKAIEVNILFRAPPEGPLLTLYLLY